MNPTILSVGTAVPCYSFAQHEICEHLIKIFSVDEASQETIRKIYNHSLIQRRYSVIGDFKNDPLHWHFWGKDFPKTSPGMTSRNHVYKREAPELAFLASEKALKQWGGDYQDITHVISVSCTGMMAPGIEFELSQRFNFAPSVNRLGINFMGCFGAFKGLSVAHAFVKENPSHRVLIVCTELCSLHFQNEMGMENMVANSLFSDGAAALVLGAQPQKHEKPLWELHNVQSTYLKETKDKMSWEASDHGFIMKLSPQVPVLIKQSIKPFVEKLLSENISASHCNWAIHPGGKSIVQAVERTLGLHPAQTQASWDILCNYGNMSSATLLFVLERLQQLGQPHPWTAALGFGPGLSIEGLLLKSL